MNKILILMVGKNSYKPGNNKHYLIFFRRTKALFTINISHHILFSLARKEKMTKIVKFVYVVILLLFVFLVRAKKPGKLFFLIFKFHSLVCRKSFILF